MTLSGPDRRQLGWYYALSQVGFEMVAPIALGWWLDGVFGTTPWILVVCVVLGLGVGFVHLILLVNNRPREDDRS